nr:epstein-barr nuclear antigen [Ipomoea batatas]GMD87556.1 epstein-barr nuclear antigen [Ipomoea batatas]
MMSVERSFEAWEEVQRQSQDFADKLTQGFTGLIQSHIVPPSFSWPNPQTPKLFDVEFPAQNFVPKDFGLAVDKAGSHGVSAIFDIGNRIGQAGADFGACLDGMVQQFIRWFPAPFKHEEIAGVSLQADANIQRTDLVITRQEDLGSLAERFRDFGYAENASAQDGSTEEESFGANLKKLKHFGRSQVGPFAFIYACFEHLPILYL